MKRKGKRKYSTPPKEKDWIRIRFVALSSMELQKYSHILKSERAILIVSSSDDL
jgi:hypothetical protein